MCVCVCVTRRDDADRDGPSWLQRHGWGFAADVTSDLRRAREREKEGKERSDSATALSQAKTIKYKYAMQGEVF